MLQGFRKSGQREDKYEKKMDEFYKNMISENDTLDPDFEKQAYYLAGETLCTACGWGYAMTEYTRLLEGDTLTLTYEDGFREVYFRAEE